MPRLASLGPAQASSSILCAQFLGLESENISIRLRDPPSTVFSQCLLKGVARCLSRAIAGEDCCDVRGWGGEQTV